MTTKGVYKLDALADKASHLFCERWYVSLREVNERDRERASLHGIKILAGTGTNPTRRPNNLSVSDFEAELKGWIDRTHLQKHQDFKRAKLAEP